MLQAPILAICLIKLRQEVLLFNGLAPQSLELFAMDKMEVSCRSRKLL